MTVCCLVWIGINSTRTKDSHLKRIIGTIIIIIYLSWIWATCWPVPVSRIQTSLQRSAMIPSASWEIVFYFYLHVVRSFSCIPVFCLKLVLFSIPLQFLYLFCNLSKCMLLFFSCISSLLLLFFFRKLLSFNSFFSVILWKFKMQFAIFYLLVCSYKRNISIGLY